MASAQASPIPAAAASTSPSTNTGTGTGTNNNNNSNTHPHPHAHSHSHPHTHGHHHHPSAPGQPGVGGSHPTPLSPPLRPPSPSSTQTNEALAGMLATAYKDIAGLKEQLVQATRRAEVAERVARSVPSSSTNGASSSSGAGGASGSSTTAAGAAGQGAQGQQAQRPDITTDLIGRITTLELQLEGLQSQLVSERERRGQLFAHWVNVEEYLRDLERSAGAARSGFGAAVQAEALGVGVGVAVGGAGGGGGAGVSPVEAYTTGQRRSHREGDEGHGPPSKRSKGNDGRGRVVYGDQSFHDISRLHAPPPLQHRVIAPPGAGGSLGPPPTSLGKHHRSPSRASSHSSVDEMLMDTVGGAEERRGVVNGIAGSMSTIPSLPGAPSGHSRKKASGGSAAGVPVFPAGAGVGPGGSLGGGAAGGGAGGGAGGFGEGGLAYPASQSVPRGGPFQQTYQSHQFVTPVTGPPIKKSKYSGGASGGSGAGLGDSPSASLIPGAAAGPLFPATNEQGQRICRQCGQPGRYKDGKCVEKWGPGPAGPGTVCDRCRKKMKRVERRGTLESQQLAAQALAAQASMATMHQSQQSQSDLGSARSLQRTDTIPANASPAGKAGANEKGGEKSAPPAKVSHVRTLMSNSVTSSGKDNRHSPHLQPPSNSNSSNSHSLQNQNQQQQQQHSQSPEQQHRLLPQASHSLQERARQELSLQQKKKMGMEKERAMGTGTGKMTMTTTSKGANGNGNGVGANGNGNGKAGGEAFGIDVTDSDADGDAEAEGEVENEIVMTLGATSTASSRQRTEEEEEEEDSVEEQTQLTGDGEDELDGDGDGDADMEGDGEGEVEDELLDAVDAAAGHR